ncbi:MAG: glycosyltransferase [Chromatiaceae bacterium]|nr:glycosyltransferase [Candidatus Thioaporhodococcus sediminis]
MSRPLVSVVIPTYNRATTLLRAIDSVRRQEVQDLEILVVDDGSTDETPDLLQALSVSGAIRYLPGDHGNAGSARNRGLCEARGSYIAFLDSDDEWLPGKLAAQMSTLADGGHDVRVVHCDMMRIQPEGAARTLRTPDVVPGRLIDPHTGDYQVKGLGIQSVMVEAALLRGDMRFDESLYALEDLDLLLRLANVARFHAIHRPLVRYYAGTGVSTQYLAVAQARRRLLERYQSILTAEPRQLAMQYAKIGLAYMRAGDSRNAQRFGRRALATAPVSVRTTLLALLPALGITWLLKTLLAVENRLTRM